MCNICFILIAFYTYEQKYSVENIVGNLKTEFNLHFKKYYIEST